MEPSLLTLLQELELGDVAVTAAIEADGTLKPVGGLWEKLGPQFIDLATRGLVRTLVVAKGQTDVPAKYALRQLGRLDGEPKIRRSKAGDNACLSERGNLCC